MLTLSLTEIRDRAEAFAKEWAGETREHAEAKSFWDGFFQVFGRTRREVASFEDPVKKITGAGKNFIDLLWKGTLIAEHKSAGKDLGKAQTQAMSYIQDLINEGRRNEVPRYIIVSDFARIALHDLDEDTHLEIKLEELSAHVEAFGFLAGIRQVQIKPQDPVNIQAAEKMAALHDVLLDGGYPEDQLDQLLTRILFCLFAEDTQIFEINQFQSFLLNHTRDDGSDLGVQLALLFDVLNTPEEKRQKSLEEHLNAFPYVNGRLFEDRLPFAGTTSEMRKTLIATTELNWALISPAIFGSMFQGVMESKERRQVGAHYTSEPDILKVINPLFMDDLRAELAVILAFKDKKERLRRLRAFHDKIASLNFLDPACGCGNFLIIAFRELRDLETEVIKHELEFSGQSGQTITDIEILTRVRVSQFHGIEIGHFPAEIARVAMWLMDHQANMHLSKELGRYFLRLPLSDAANIVTANALQIPWETVIPKDKCSFILGNPPFVGKKEQNAEQKKDMKTVWMDVKGTGVLDFVTAWYLLSSEYISGTKCRCAFVSTNSITQGEQASALWPYLIHRGLRIRFAHRTFNWQSAAKGKAHVHVVIIGFDRDHSGNRILFDYDDIKGDATARMVTNINPYLVEGPNLVVGKRMKPLCHVPEMDFGSKAADFGHLILSREDANELIMKYPFTKTWVRPFLGSEEFLNGSARFCLWLKGVSPTEIKQCPPVLERIEKCRQERSKSVDANTRRWAAYPSLFQADRQPEIDYLVVPKVSSERRKYLPLGFRTPRDITNPSILVIPGAENYHFGILGSSMHMAWMRQVCGRMKSDYQYSNTIVYNTFPWPTTTDSQKLSIEMAAKAVLVAREQFPAATLADLYDPRTMPPSLAKAHDALDRAVDRCYRPQGFQNDRERVEHLFQLYEKLVAPLAVTMTKKTRK